MENISLFLLAPPFIVCLEIRNSLLFTVVKDFYCRFSGRWSFRSLCIFCFAFSVFVSIWWFSWNDWKLENFT